MDLGSDNDSDGSKERKREEAYEKRLEFKSRSDVKTAKWLKKLADDKARRKPTI